MSVRIIPTADNSHTLFVPELNETYHSQNGAINEAEIVYIQAGLAHVATQKKDIRIFELGLGTGLNALLTWLHAEKNGLTIYYDAVEKFPISHAISTQLNYAHELKADNKLERLHTAPWEIQSRLSVHFELTKIHSDIYDSILPTHHYDLIYYDAFGPSKQAEIWEFKILERICKSIKPNGTLVTYCSQGQFRRNLIQLGFSIEKLPGPTGKREITRATKTI